MAQVWKAHDERLERPVAVKFLSPHVAQDPDNLVRFFSEAQSIARISHPGVITVLDFGEHDGRPFLVMEYVGGGSLADVTGRPMDPGRACSIVARVAAAAGAAHAAGVVHRDVKPANVLLDESGNPKLADFGIASARGHERLTASGTTVGSPHYVSPEQAMDVGTSPASDVYALGVVLYELITGARPFDADNITAIVVAHVEHEPRPPGELVDGLDHAVEDVVMRCLAKDPEQRYSDGAELAAALASVAPDRAPANVPPTAPFGAAAAAPGPLAAAVEESSDASAPGHDRRPPARVLVAAGVVVAVLTALLAVALLGGPSGDDAVATTPGERRGTSGAADDRGDRPRGGSATDADEPTDDGAADGDASAPTTRPDDDSGGDGPNGDDGGGGGEGEGDDGGEGDDPTDEPTDDPIDEPTDDPIDEPTDAPAEGAGEDASGDGAATGDDVTSDDVGTDGAPGDDASPGPPDG